MKSIVLLSLLVITLGSCDRVVRYEDIHQEDNLVYVLGERKPFTGKVNFHPEEDGSTQLEVFEGKVAKTLRYYSNGKPQYVRRGYDGEYLVFYDESGKSIAPKDYFNLQEKLHKETKERQLQASIDSIRLADSIAAVEYDAMEKDKQEEKEFELDLGITDRTYERLRELQRQKH